ncbi:hypothetical protein E8E12_009586 [Didymella heteroderae]|uniref:Uncharacterized protein n=1 Tax=Didymella heteroderae TaxID=1769908 RepID=A0A9P4WYC7_9PLEO|nr:hypothetical protein E8E12_009586 [Didymella heteroderae]
MPAELRNRIYIHAFGPDDILVDKLKTHYEQVLFFENPQPYTVRQSLYLTQVCRQIYSETKLLYWESRTFRFGPTSDDDSSIRNTLKVLSAEKRKAIRHIAVHKEEVKLDNVWEMLPQLRGLKTMVLWGSYFTWGTDRDLAGQLSTIRVEVRHLAGSEVEATVETVEEDK